jgi:hypothetical protein
MNPLIETDKGTSPAPEVISSPRSVRSLILDLGSNSSFVRCAAARALGEMRDPRAFEPLVAALSHYDKNTKIAAAEALGALGDTRAIEPLVAVMRRESFETLEAIKAALEDLGASKTVATEQTKRAIRDGVTTVRRPGVLKMLIGGILCAFGIITAISNYLAASPGSAYTIPSGIIVVGAGYFLRGLYDYLAK